MGLGAITKDVIFRVGSAGTSTTATKFKKLSLAIGAVTIVIALVAKAITKLVNDSQALDLAMDKNTINMGRFNAETAGLIDTLSAYQNANKLTAAGMKITEDQMAAIGKAAIKLSKDTGITATQAYENLTKSISMGSSRALKALGIDLDNTEDLVLAQAEAIDKITKGYLNYKVKIDTAKEATFAFGNSVDTIAQVHTAAVIDLMAETFGELVLSIDSGVESLAEFETLMVETNGQYSLWLLSHEGLMQQLELGVATLLGWEDGIRSANFAIDEQVDKMKTLATLEQELQRLQNQRQAEQAALLTAGELTKELLLLDTALEKLSDTSTKNIEGQRQIIGLYKQLKTTVAAVSTKTDLDATRFLEKFRDKFIVAEEAVSRADKKFKESLLESAFGDEAKKREEERLIFTGTEIEETTSAERAAFEESKVALQVSVEEKLFHLRRKAEEDELKAVEKAERDRAKAGERALKEQEKALEKSLKRKEKMQREQLNAGLTALSNIGVLMESENRAAFIVGKTAAISEATISTALGAQHAFTSLARIPYVGVPLGIAAAGAAVIAGAVRIKQIAATTFDGGGSAPASAGAALPATAAGANASINAGQEQEIIDRRPIILNVGGRKITDIIVEDSIRSQKRGERGLQVRT